MKTYYLDTNIFIRAITEDDTAKAEVCRKIFAKLASDEISAYVPDHVICEAVFVLSSPKLYAIDRATISRELTSLLLAKSIEISNKPVVLTALNLYGRSKLDFADCLTVFDMKKFDYTSLLSYDQDFDDELFKIKRVENI